MTSDNIKAIIKEIDKSREYLEFRKCYTEEIQRRLIQNNGRFVMTHQLTTNIIIDVLTAVEKLGYEIHKK